MERSAKRRRLTASRDAAALPGFAQVDLEHDYLKRSQKKRKDESNRLMVKKGDAWIEDERVKNVQPEQEVEEVEETGSDGEDSGVADIEPKPVMKKPKVSPKEEIRQAKEELARIAGLVSESPEEHIGMLGSLSQFADSDNAVVKKLALGTQLAVYKDIIPGYRIRPLSQEDLQAKLSKEVKKLRNHEQGLLGGYKGYVQSLSTLAKRGEGADASVGSVAISCACALLTSVPHFNCRNDLIGLVVQRLSGRSVDADFIKCREALEQLFQNDEEGHSSLEAVSQLTKMMKTKDYRAHESVLNTFLHLRLLSEFAHKASTNAISKDDADQQTNPKFAKKQKQKREFRTKRERKVMKERKEVEKEMKEADAAVSYEERDKNQAETLKLVFVAYFRILKARTQHLMGAVLEGLAKYAHLINQDFFGDILEALKDLINDAQASLSAVDDEEDLEADGDMHATSTRNATRESLLCIITAFALLQGQIDVAKSANALHLDLNFFITHLYRTLLPLSMDQDIELSAKTAHLADPNGLEVPNAAGSRVNVATTTVLLLRSLSAVLLPPSNTRAVPPLRVAAFVKQLSTLALHLPQKSALAVTGLLQQVAKVHGKRISSLWFSEERRGDGVFNAVSEEVEGSNVFTSTVWEGELMRVHWDTKVREGWKAVEGNVLEAR